MGTSLSAEQIGGIVVGALGVIGYLFKTAKDSAKKADDEKPAPGTPGNPWLLLDPRRLEMAVNELGALQVALAKLNTTLEKTMDEQQDNTRALDRNRETAEKVAEEARELRVRIQTLTSLLPAAYPSQR